MSKSKDLVPFVLSTAIAKEGDGHVTTSAIMKGSVKVGETSPTGLKIFNARQMPFEDYLEIGRLLGAQNRRLQWVIGDWLNLVEDIYPDRYSQAADVTGLSHGTLMNRASICRRYPEERRRDGIAFSIHADVAYLEPRDRERWLDRVVKGDWTREILREHRSAEKSAASSVADPGVTGKSGDGREEHPSENGVPANEVAVVPGDPVPSARTTCPHCGGSLTDAELDL